MDLIPLDDANGDLPLVRVTGGGVAFPPGLPGQLVGYDAAGVPVAVDAPSGGGYDDGPLLARVDALEVAAQDVAATFEQFDQAFTAVIAQTALQGRQYTDQQIAAIPPPEPGPQGPQGPAGPVGPMGPQGLTGETGAPGPKGDTGAGLTILGSLPDPSELPATGADGDGYLINGNLWVWDGGAFIDAGNIQGPAGPQGETGPQGGQGPQGVKGDTGDQGPVGPSGPVGAQGEQGPKGDTGETGPQGATGPEGATGPAGPQGATGPAGPAGPAGQSVTITTVNTQAAFDAATPGPLEIVVRVA